MDVDRDCPDCGASLERMELQGTDLAGELAIVSASSGEGFLGGLRADEILTPVPYVCQECRRTLCYAEG
ncbi:hypothetical protein [Haloglomus litoreum]|uniref:hypothetical protein n=1 Tax=Haloglomus litoreum TaxID=3034026 RepID=UPI0023E7AF5A|nr:hypothetical protein [Haloglomus sp. DT116]